MAADEKWYFTKEQLRDTPSRKCEIDADKELSYRQQAANFIQDMGQRLVVTQLCINTAIVYMHRFYVFHSLSQFHRNAIAAAALFLAAKVEEQPRKLEHVIKVAHMCLHREQTPPDTKSEQYLEQAQDLVFNENVLLQTLGFDVAIDHPHTHVVRCCQLVKASKDLAQTSYFMASNSLHLTTMCLQYKPTVVACFCIHLACKWSNWEIPQSNEGKHWFWYVDRSVTAELLQQLTTEFLHIFDKCPSRLKKKIISISEKQSSTMHHPPAIANSPFDVEPRKVNSPASDGGPTFQSQKISSSENKDEVKKPSIMLQSRPQVDYREYREKKERERLEREKLIGSSVSTSGNPQDLQKHHSHHHKQGTGSSISGSSLMLTQSKNPVSSQKISLHHNHHHRPDQKLQQPQQRHTTNSSSSQSRDPSRDRPRLPAVPAYPHTKDHNSMTETTSGVPEISSQIFQDGSQISQNPNDRLSNNNHNPHRLQQHEKRGYDPRHKLIEHRKDDPKNYMKFNDQVRQDRQRKPDTIEQRSEEVRKLIEKPISIPKPRAEIQKEEFIASMLKQSHHTSKYPEKMPSTHNTVRGAFPHDVSKISNASKSFQQIPHSGLHQQMQHAPQHIHSATQISKDMKNGNSNLSSGSGNNVDDPKAEKRPRLEEPIPSVKHKSLFSPEKVPTSREVHSQRTKTIRQKTPPVVSVKATKLERIPDIQMGLGNLISPFASPQGIPETQSNLHGLQASKRSRTSSTNETEPPAKLKTEESSGFESMKMLGRIPDLIQPIRDNPGSTNGRTSSVANDLKPPELIKPFDPDNSTHRPKMTNGLDSVNIKQESTFEQLALERLEMKNDYMSPLKSAQSISALLQEPLAPMSSSLLSTSMTDSGIFSQPLSQQSTSSNKNNNSINRNSENDQVSTQAINIPPEHQLKEEILTTPSTVDISALSTSAQVLPDLSTMSNSASSQDQKSEQIRQKSEHHKSEKKKKKEKHKHKDKSKEKHKHKHKEKHRENSTDPIKITIPKDKLNFSGESTEVSATLTVSLEKKSSLHGAGLKIKIPKEKLKNPEPAPAPLKIKIRTSGTVGDFPESRKRDRTRDSIEGVPPLKKPPSVTVHQNLAGQQKPNDKQQNGRHYPVTNNKVRGGGRGVSGRQFNTRASVPGLFNQNIRDYYPSVDPQEVYARNPRLPVPQPRPMGFNHSGAQEFYFPNYPPPTIFNPGGYFCDPAMFYQYQQQFSMYPQTSSLIMTADGAIDTSVPPPSIPIAPNLNSDQTQPPPLPSGPPPNSSPPPPPPPE